MNGILAINAPLVSWCHNYLGNFTSAETATGLNNVWSCGASCFDRFLMMHMLVGSHPTVPSAWGDHTNINNPQTDPVYLDFAPLFALLQGKRWVLEPRAVATNQSDVWANIFTNLRGEVVIPLSYQDATSKHSGGGAAKRPGCQAFGTKKGAAIASHNLVNRQLPLGANASECAAACCETRECSGYTYQPTTIAHNGVCAAGPRPCCWLKSNSTADPLHRNSSSLPGIVSGYVSAPPAPPPEKPQPVQVTVRLAIDTASATAYLLSPGGAREAMPLERHKDAGGVEQLVAVVPPMPRGGAVLVIEGLQDVRGL